MNISLVFMFYFKVPKSIRLNTTHYVIIKISSKRELKQINKLLGRKKFKKSNLVYVKQFIFYKNHSINEFVRRSFSLKQNDLTEFKYTLESFYYDTEEI